MRAWSRPNPALDGAKLNVIGSAKSSPPIPNRSAVPPTEGGMHNVEPG